VSEDRRQFGLLWRAFLARFLDNDLAGPDVDLRRSFVWVVSGLAVPQLFLSIVIITKYESVARSLGVEAVAVHTLVDKTWLLGLGMLGIGFITVVVWDALLLDRRDCHVLCTLPVRVKTILLAKAAALGWFWLVVTAAINVIGTVAFSLSAGHYFGPLRYFAAHLVTAFAASAFVFLWLIAVQGLVVGFFSAAWQRRISMSIQLVVGAVLLSAFLLLPPAGFVLQRLVQTGATWSGLVEWLPAAWYVALYEALLGRSWPLLDPYAARAVWTLGLGAVAAGASFALRLASPAR
jgi:hypothetical protein